MMNLLQQTLAKITVPDTLIREQVQQRIDRLTQPGALGRLGSMFSQYAGITGELRPLPPRACMVVACADHGVAVHGISAYPVETTLHMTANYLVSKGASANAFANFSGSDMVVVDVGVAGDLSHVPGLWNRNIAYGTADFTKGPAMTRAQAIQAIETGIEIVNDRVKQGYNCFSLGEMGIGNTSSSAAIVAAFSQLEPEVVTGRGTGISDSRMQVKINIVRQGLAVNHPNPCDGIDVLSKVGGFELGALAGVVLGAAANRCAVIIDGSNTTAAALIAAAIQPICKQYLFASHLSAEPAHRFALGLLDLKPCVDMGVRLGEAIGASIVVDMLTADAVTQQSLDLSTTSCQALTAQTEAFRDVGRVLCDITAQIKPLDVAAMEACQLRIDNLTKPFASLNAFEHLARQLSGITGDPRPKRLRKAILVITDGPCAASPAVTGFAKHAGAELALINMSKSVDIPQSTNLTHDQVVKAIQTGIDAACAQMKHGTQVVGIGTISHDARQTAELFIQTGLAMDFQSADVLLAMLEKTGSLVLAGLAGVILGAAAEGAAVVLDDLETSAAALIAVAIAPSVRDYLIASHGGTDSIHQAALDKLGLRAHLDLDLSLGDGTGAALGIRLLDASLHMLNDMKTFGEAEVAVAQDGPGVLRQSKTVKD
ncbi:nicotinate-nucleotide--dimethylbenzimidazole phosphoribosyltransferase [Anaerosporomusa subterranea]|uniref:nicotinate-nucleotide--dimethylbenzimidazole phosphoribosyltransferase n=1 Tax=Anaerosporomusa subterranea TaxID=1794912 RepID=UPI0012E95D8A|nr:nicotinate-nucleotide--dimethylbenzimidazole phosphoribosyltransferase [Anaerosporomusa subterranea]